MKQKTGFQAWFDASRDDVARVFTNLGEGLEDGKLNWEAISIDVPESVEVEIECGTEDEAGDEYEFEFTMSWDASDVTEEPATNGTVEHTSPDEETTAVEDGGPTDGGAPDSTAPSGPEGDTEGPSRPAPDEPGEGNHPADRSF